MSQSNADRNLLFGILALQMDFITRDALVAAMHAWVLKKTRPLGRILVEQGALAEDEHALLEPLVAKHLHKHGNDPGKSLAALRSIGPAREDLESIADPDLHASLVHVSAARPADDPYATPTPATLGTPTSAGTRFRILRPHAKGGLGKVSVALDEELDRQVALKEIQEAHADHPRSRARFVREAEITGKLEHPGIIPVYGLGHDPTGRPFYAMRFIRGDSLAEAIARFHAAERPGRDPGERTLQLRELLGRFLDVCNALAYAHSRGVLHRDLKPGNIMLGPFGETLVVDWGLAKPLGRVEGIPGTSEGPLRTSLGGSLDETVEGSDVGTPAYMSPEQAEGRLDELGPASDVYGLGATLYSLLTGRAPVEGPDKFEVLRKVQRGEFPAPRSIAPHVPRPLEAICLKAMARKPSDRYASPKDLAADIQRWLADEPVSAWREPFSLRARRWARRHRTLVTTAAVSALVATVLGGSGWTWFEHREQARQAQAALAARDALDQAIRLGGEARAASDPSKWAEAVSTARRALDLLGPDGNPALRQRMAITLATLEDERRHAQQAAERRARDRQMEERLAEARLLRAGIGEGYSDEVATTLAAYGQAYRDYGIDIEALTPQEAAARVRASAIREALAAALDDWAWFTEERDSRSRLLTITRQAEPDLQRNAVRDAVSTRDGPALQRLARDRDVVRLPEATVLVLGRALMQTGQVGDAVALLQQAQRLHPDNLWINHDLARACCESKPPKYEAAIRYFTAAVALRPGSSGVHNNLGNALRFAGQMGEAIAAYRKAIELKPNFAAAYSNLGIALVDAGRMNEAIAAYRKAIELKPDFATAYSNLGKALSDSSQTGEAIAAYRKAIVLKPDHDEAYTNLGIALSAVGQKGEAIAAHRKAIELKPDDAPAYSNLGVSLFKAGQMGEAIAADRKAIELKPDYAQAYYNLGNALRAAGQTGEAIAAHRKAIELKPDLVEAHYSLGIDLRASGQTGEAIAAYRKAIELKPNYAEAYCGLGLGLQVKGQFPEALAALERGHDLGSKNPRWSHPSARWVSECRRLVELDAKLPAALRGEGKPADAVEQLGLAGLCYRKSLYAASSRFFGEAFAARPELAEDLDAENVYNAACAAALAGVGQGKDDPPPDATARARLRSQALTWLRADLAARTKRLEGGPPQARAAVAQTLQHWQRDPDLAGLRDEAALAKLPEDERKEWRTLWGEVAALLQRAQ